MSTKKKRGRIGSSFFSDFLKKEGTQEVTTAAAIKRVLAWELEQAMSKEGVTKSVTPQGNH